MRTETPNDSATVPGDTTGWTAAIRKCPATTPVTLPMRPPRPARRTASARNWSMMSLVKAPSDLRIPISRVRSVTVTSMMFITPIPPMRSVMPATMASRIRNDRAVALPAARRSAALNTLKSGGSPGLTLWVWRRVVVISVTAELIPSRETAWTPIAVNESMLPTTLSMTVDIGAKITSSWSWSPFDPRRSSTPTIWNGTWLNWIVWPTGLAPLPKTWSTTVRPITATLARDAWSASVNQRPFWIRMLRISSRPRSPSRWWWRSATRPSRSAPGPGRTAP